MKAIAYLVSNTQQMMDTIERNEKLAMVDPIKVLTAEYDIHINLSHITFAFLIEDNRKIKCVIQGIELILKNEPQVWQKIKKYLKKQSKC